MLPENSALRTPGPRPGPQRRPAPGNRVLLDARMAQARGGTVRICDAALLNAVGERLQLLAGGGAHVTFSVETEGILVWTPLAGSPPVPPPQRPGCATRARSSAGTSRPKNAPCTRSCR